MKSVLLGMSGGVDSSVAAALLKQEGYQVIGITMVLIPNNEEETVKDAKTVADFLGIEHRVLHLEEEFRDKVILPFIDSYQEGSTPNPCILCNEHFKFCHEFTTLGSKYIYIISVIRLPITTNMVVAKNPPMIIG